MASSDEEEKEAEGDDGSEYDSEFTEGDPDVLQNNVSDEQGAGNDPRQTIKDFSATLTRTS